MAEFFNILGTIIQWFQETTIPIGVGSFSTSISLWSIMIGIIAINIAITVLFSIFE